ncbi:Ppx/GppA phosphatase [Anaeromyxobacter sp. K]|uniref:Ppx/GppA phosphatase family protein n=1 Tax=Anaeromyxobacter sp. (strain K) TaxID=447217 RepID=UPI00015F8E45|nr:Ppx/GppA phosphatase family protein [Anaeromyxobacter sp. K]ACG71931.1 Ppx/GppA phosphatase [Anaeromyxobacter sp. K]
MAGRLASIDVGTNTVLLLVAERRGGALAPVRERAEITRLGRGVDATGRLDPAAIRETVATLAAFAAEARALGADEIACVATSAARDAANGDEFFEAARAAAGLSPRVISGDEEARLVYGSAFRDFGAGGPLAVLDVGGGSTEFIVGEGPEPRARVSLQVGAVRLTERHVRADPVRAEELAAMRAGAREALAPLAALGAGAGARLVGVAGTVTTLSAVAQALPAYDAERVHGAELRLDQVERLLARLAALPVAARAALPGMEPKRADVILGGGVVVAEAMRLAGFDRLTVSDRGVRWGLLYELAGP